jgi:hypothetical protein
VLTPLTIPICDLHLHSPIHNYNLCHYYFTITFCSLTLLLTLCGLLDTHSLLGLLSLDSPRVLASNSGHSFSWGPKLSLHRSHSFSWLTVHLLELHLLLLSSQSLQYLVICQYVHKYLHFICLTYKVVCIHYLQGLCQSRLGTANYALLIVSSSSSSFIYSIDSHGQLPMDVEHVTKQHEM